jgi:hypothetical protein
MEIPCMCTFEILPLGKIHSHQIFPSVLDTVLIRICKDPKHFAGSGTMLRLWIQVKDKRFFPVFYHAKILLLQYVSGPNPGQNCGIFLSL